MNLFAKIILTTENEVKDFLINRLSLVEKNIENNLSIYTWINKNSSEKENLILIKYEISQEVNVNNYIMNNYDPLKIIIIWTSHIIDSLDLKDGDIMLPNTIINSKNEAIFLEYAPWENFDLNKFWLLLNWICLTTNNQISSLEELKEIKENNSPDIIDEDSFYILEKLSKNNLIDKLVLIKIIWKNQDNIQNWVDILELIL